MTVAARIRPKAPHKVATPQCCVPVPDSSFWSESYRKRRRARMLHARWEIERCGRAASVTIGENTYCGQHGAMLALAMLLGEGVDWSQPGDMEPR